MDAIGPGDWVECIRAQGQKSPLIGRIFRVRSVFDTGEECTLRHGPCGGLLLDGLPLRKGIDAHAMCCFRPIYRPKQEIIEALKAPPQKTKELA